MRCVLGIGNPGKEYERTRHNCGFLVVDELARRHGVGRWATKWQAEVAEIAIGDERVLLVKPQAFVNLSGGAAQAVLAFYKLAPADLLVVVDDLNLALGDLRLRANGSAGGHNGLRDIEEKIGQAYPRLRVGIGRPRSPDAQVGFVLGGFSPDERADAEAMIAKAADCAERWAREGVEVACRFNGPLRPPPPKPRPAKPDIPPTDAPPA